MRQSQNINQIVTTFVENLTEIIENNVRESAIASLGGDVKRGPGRPAGVSSSKPNPQRRKGPIQLCPVPGCKDRAAPVFGMVCKKHKDLPKSKIKAFREARKAKKTYKIPKSLPIYKIKPSKKTGGKKSIAKIKVNKPAPSKKTVKKPVPPKKTPPTPAAAK